MPTHPLQDDAFCLGSIALVGFSLARIVVPSTCLALTGWYSIRTFFFGPRRSPSLIRLPMTWMEERFEEAITNKTPSRRYETYWDDTSSPLSQILGMAPHINICVTLRRGQINALYNTRMNLRAITEHPRVDIARYGREILFVRKVLLQYLRLELAKGLG